MCTITRATVVYQQIDNGNIANQIHGFTIDYSKFIPIDSLYKYVSVLFFLENPKMVFFDEIQKRIMNPKYSHSKRILWIKSKSGFFRFVIQAFSWDRFRHSQCSLLNMLSLNEHLASGFSVILLFERMARSS